MAATATTPTTTPAAMPATLGLLDLELAVELAVGDDVALEDADMVTTIVCPGAVTTDGGAGVKAVV